jgi:hypothetical protein
MKRAIPICLLACLAVASAFSADVKLAHKNGFALVHPSDWTRTVDTPDNDVAVTTPDGKALFAVKVMDRPVGTSSIDILTASLKALNAENMYEGDSVRIDKEDIARLGAEEGSQAIFYVKAEGKSTRIMLRIITKGARLYMLTEACDQDYEADWSRALWDVWLSMTLR